MASIKELAKGRRDEYRITVKDLHVKEGWNCRDVDFDERDAEDMTLARSIAAVGVQQPLTAYMEDGKLFVEDGHRRLAATKYAIAHLKANKEMLLPVRMGEKEATDAQRIRSQVTRNAGKPFTPLELAKAFAAMAKAGMKDAEIAADCGVTRAYVGQLATLHGAPKAVHDMVRSGTVAATLAIETIKANEGDAKKATSILRDAVKAAKAAGKTRATRKHMKDDGEAAAPARKGKKSKAAETAPQAETPATGCETPATGCENPILAAFQAAYVTHQADEAGQLVVTFDPEAFALFTAAIGFTTGPQPEEEAESGAEVDESDHDGLAEVPRQDAEEFI